MPPLTPRDTDFIGVALNKVTTVVEVAATPDEVWAVRRLFKQGLPGIETQAARLRREST